MGLLILSEADTVLGENIDYVDEVWVDGKNVATMYTGTVFDQYIQQTPKTFQEEVIVYVPFKLTEVVYSDSILLELKRRKEDSNFTISCPIQVRFINTHGKNTYDATVIGI